MADFESYRLAPKRLALTGELTLSSAQSARTQLRSALAAAEAELEVDLSRVSRCDTAGVQVLLVTYREAEQAKKRLSFVAASSAVASVFDLLRLTSMLGRKAT